MNNDQNVPTVNGDAASQTKAESSVTSSPIPEGTPLDDQFEQMKTLMLASVPENGNAIGNKTLRPIWVSSIKDKLHLDVNEDAYWDVRDRLIDAGKLVLGRGQGGSVKRSFGELPPVAAAPAIAAEAAAERALYDPFLRFVQERYTKDYGIKYFVAQKTAEQGRRNTGGKWTRPDITLVAVRVYQFIPGRSLEVVTFELKPEGQVDVSGVFEAAAHSIFANKSYLAVQAPDCTVDSRVKRECERFGIGLITFSDPSNLDSFDFLIEPDHRRPSPDEVDEFIGTQFSADNQNMIRELIR